LKNSERLSIYEFLSILLFCKDMKIHYCLGTLTWYLCWEHF